MRVRIALARRTVGGPTGVGDAQTAHQRFTGQGLFQFRHLAVTARALQRTVVGKHGNTGAVIATVLKTFQAFEQNGRDITFGDCANDSTHKFLLIEGGA